MKTSAILFVVAGVALSFMPDIMLQVLNIPSNNIIQLFPHLLGACYFAFGMLNWMAKGSLRVFTTNQLR